MTHKRRMSASDQVVLPESAPASKSATFTTPYGRLCPIETAEGPNIGLIVSLAVYARINEFGFVETAIPHLKFEGSSEITYLSADDEEDKFIAQANQHSMRRATSSASVLAPVSMVTSSSCIR